MLDVDSLNRLLKKPELENLEFKEAKSKFDRSKKLPDYCAGIANAGGGKLLLGVNDDGVVIGSSAFQGTYNKLSNELFDKLQIHINVYEVLHPDGRVLVFDIPSRHPGKRVKSTGDYTYPIRRGESLVEMDDETTKLILNELAPDYTASLVSGVGLEALDPEALKRCKKLWADKANRKDYLDRSDEEMLQSLEMMSGGIITYAALLLLGSSEALSRYLPDAELIFEWRQIPGKNAYDLRKEWRDAFLLIYDGVWKTLDDKNSRFPFQEGFFQKDIWAYVEKPFREALLNAFCHRNYEMQGHSIFIKASPEAVEIKSPGTFPNGVNAQNILDSSAWRNRRLAEALQKIGLVERSGQGMNDIYEDSLKNGKGAPVIKELDGNFVELFMPSQVKDPEFIAFLEKASNESQFHLSLKEILALDEIREEGKVKSVEFRDKFLQYGLIETVGRGRGAMYMLSRNYYVHSGNTGVHTRLVGLSREKNKELILSHIEKNGEGKTSEFVSAFPELNNKDINNLLQELRKADKIEFKGHGKHGYWVLK